MYIIKRKCGNVEIVSNDVVKQSWFGKRDIDFMVDIGYYESFFDNNLGQILDLIKSGVLKARSKTIYFNENKEKIMECPFLKEEELER